MFSLAKYSVENVFSDEAGSNYLMTLKKYTMSSEREPDRPCVVTVVSSMIQLDKNATFI